jgi:hypothetical protein
MEYRLSSTARFAATNAQRHPQSGSRVPHLVRAPLRVLQSPLDAAARRPQAITLQQIARQSFAKRVVEPAGHRSGAAEKRPPPKSRREGARGEDAFQHGCVGEAYLAGQTRECL